MNFLVNNKMYIGAHTSIRDGILDGISYIQKIGGNTTQIFLGSNKSSSLKMKTKITDEECARIKRYCELNKFKLFIHAAYVLNFATFPPGGRIKYALDNLIYDLEWGYKMGVLGVVVHLGFKKDLDEEEAYKNMADNIVYAIKHTMGSPVKILLETPAGAGTQIGTTVSSFKKVFSLIKSSLDDDKVFNNRVGICLDTAHIFSSGNDISGLGVEYLEYFCREMRDVLNEPISLIHLNDSKVELNSRRDIHAGIGQGYIYGEKSNNSNAIAYLSFASLIHYFTSQIKRNGGKRYIVPMVLETHGAGGLEKDMGQYKQEISLVKEVNAIGKSELDKYIAIVRGKGKLKKSKKLKDRFKINIVPLEDKKKTVKGTKINRGAVSRNGSHYVLYKENKKIVEVLDLVKKYYTITRDPIRANAYSMAVYQIKRYPYRIKAGKDVAHLDGIGAKMVIKIDDILARGTLVVIEALDIERVVKEHEKKKSSEFESVLGFGPKMVKEMDVKGIKSIKELKAKKMKLTKLQEIGVRYHKALSKLVSRPEAEYVHGILNKIYQDMKTTNKDKIVLLPAGSFPSGKMESKDIDMLVVKEDDNKISMKDMMEYFKKMAEFIEKKNGFKIVEVISVGKSNTMLLIRYKYDGIKRIRHLDLKMTTKSELPFAYLHFTSGADYNRYVRDKAKKLGYKLNDKGLFDSAKRISDKVIGVDNDYELSDIRKAQLLKRLETNLEMILNYLGISI